MNLEISIGKARKQETGICMSYLMISSLILNMV